LLPERAARNIAKEEHVMTHRLITNLARLSFGIAAVLMIGCSGTDPNFSDISSSSDDGAVAGTESAVRDPGTYFTNVPCASPCQLQVRYVNTQGDWHHYTRADGYSVYLGSGNGYIRKVELDEYTSSQNGERVVYYTGSATSATMLNIPTTYLPLMLNDPFNAQAYLKVTTSTGKSFFGSVQIGD
jgi:hypothetical protein